MIRQSFNDGWAFRPKAPLFASLTGGGPWQNVQLPHDALRDTSRSAEAAGGTHTGFHPDGVFEYEKTFDVPDSWKERSVSLEFEGIYRSSIVSINGEVAATRPNGYAGIIIDADRYLRFGKPNRITVDARSHDDSRWYTGVGIYRDTWVHIGPDVHVPPQGLRVMTPEIDTEQAVVVLETTVRNASRHLRAIRVSAAVRDADDAVLATTSFPVTLLPGEDTVVATRLLVRAPRLWSADDPNLYVAEIDVEGGDAASTHFGIRRLQLDAQHGLRVNGVTVKLRGGAVHHDNGPLGAASYARAEERRVQILKDAGYNAIRSAHNPISRAMLDACDRIGMFVMDELTDVWTVPKNSFDYALDFPEWWERDVEAMVAKDFNHPSVIIYSIGNEVSEVGTPIGSTWGRRLAQKVRALDPTRYTTNAINGIVAVTDVLAGMAQEAPTTDEAGEAGVNDMLAGLAETMAALTASDLVRDRTEEAHSQVDIAGHNYAEARYLLDRERFPDRIVVGTETFANNLDVLWPLVEENAHVIGDFVWTAWEYLGETGIGRATYADEAAGLNGAYPWLISGTGTVDVTGRRRPVSYWREIVWGLRSRPYIAVERPELHDRRRVGTPWSWTDAIPTWTFDSPEGAPLVVEVYSADEEVELRVDGNPIGRAAFGAEKAYVARLSVPYTPGVLEAVTFTGGKERGRAVLRTADAPSIVRLVPDREEVTSAPDDLVFIDLLVEDEHGTLVTDSDAVIALTVHGPGELIAFASAQPATKERFDSTERTVWNGHALAIIRPTGPGSVQVAATAPGLPSATAQIKVVAA